MLLFLEKKKRISHYTQTGVSFHMNPYINFLVSLWFTVLKEFVPHPQTHVSLCRNGGGPSWRRKQRSTKKGFLFWSFQLLEQHFKMCGSGICFVKSFKILIESSNWILQRLETQNVRNWRQTLQNQELSWAVASAEFSTQPMPSIEMSSSPLKDTPGPAGKACQRFTSRALRSPGTLSPSEWLY